VSPVVFAVKVKDPFELAAAVTRGLAVVAVPKSVEAPPPVALGSVVVLLLIASTRFPMVAVSLAPIRTVSAVAPTGPVVKVYVTPPTDIVLPFTIVLPAPPPEVVRVPVAAVAVTTLTGVTPFVPAPAFHERDALFETAVAIAAALAVFAVKVKTPFVLAAAVTRAFAVVLVPKLVEVATPPPVALLSKASLLLMASTRFPIVSVSVAPTSTVFAVVGAPVIVAELTKL
jgi:hypothetical protein